MEGGCTVGGREVGGKGEHSESEAVEVSASAIAGDRGKSRESPSPPESEIGGDESVLWVLGPTIKRERMAHSAVERINAGSRR